MSTCASPRSRLLTRRYLVRVLLINLVAAVIAVVVVAWFGLLSHLSDVGYALATSLIYAYVLGLPCGIVLPFVATALAHKPPAIRYGALFACLAVLICVCCVLATLCTVLVGINSMETARAVFFVNLRISLIIGLAVGGIIFGQETLRGRIHAAELGQERARKLAAEARLSSLESRVHPHFLFNTLNSVSALIHEDPVKAEETVGRLAALLRFSLDANQHSLAPLHQELKVVRDYLEIEKTRFGDRLRYSIESPDDLSEVQIPLLAVQTLVENSIKHVVSRRREGGDVSVRVRRADGALAVDVSDSGPGFFIAEVPAEHGLDNLVARLRVLYADAASVENIVDERGRAAVCVRVPVQAS